MIELTFSDCTKESLRMAKELKNPLHFQRFQVVVDTDKGTASEDVNVPQPPFIGQGLEGQADEVLGIWLLADIGKISPINSWEHRINLWQSMQKEYDYFEDDQDWPDLVLKQTQEFAKRLELAKNRGEPIRIWWSDSPGETCGFYWAMHFLHGAKGSIYSVKIPTFIKNSTGNGFQRLNGTGELSPDKLVELSKTQKLVEEWERSAYATEWMKLVQENSSLRAIVNGKLLSVCDEFYDSFLWKSIQDEEVMVSEAIGQTLTEGPAGVSDFWYANRIRHFIKTGQLQITKPAKQFYRSIIKRTGKTMN